MPPKRRGKKRALSPAAAAASSAAPRSQPSAAAAAAPSSLLAAAPSSVAATDAPSAAHAAIQEALRANLEALIAEVSSVSTRVAAVDASMYSARLRASSEALSAEASSLFTEIAAIKQEIASAEAAKHAGGKRSAPSTGDEPTQKKSKADPAAAASSSSAPSAAAAAAGNPHGLMQRAAPAAASPDRDADPKLALLRRFFFDSLTTDMDQVSPDTCTAAENQQRITLPARCTESVFRCIIQERNEATQLHSSQPQDEDATSLLHQPMLHHMEQHYQKWGRELDEVLSSTTPLLPPLASIVRQYLDGSGKPFEGTESAAAAAAEDAEVKEQPAKEPH